MIRSEGKQLNASALYYYTSSLAVGAIWPGEGAEFVIKEITLVPGRKRASQFIL